MKKIFAFVGCLGHLSLVLCANEHLPNVEKENSAVQEQAVEAPQGATPETKNEVVRNATVEVFLTEKEKAAIALREAQEKLENIKAVWRGASSSMPTRSVNSTDSKEKNTAEKEIDVFVEDDENSPIVRIWISGIDDLNKKDLHLLTGAKTTYQKGVISLVTKKVYYQDN